MKHGLLPAVQPPRGNYTPTQHRSRSTGNVNAAKTSAQRATEQAHAAANAARLADNSSEVAIRKAMDAANAKANA